MSVPNRESQRPVAELALIFQDRCQFEPLSQRRREIKFACLLYHVRRPNIIQVAKRMSLSLASRSPGLFS